MMNFLNSINIERATTPPLFITLTYPDQFPTDKAAWTEHFNRRFRRRLERRYPGAAAIWRKEFQRRKTGENAGKWAPHFHLLLFVEDEPSQLYEWLSRAWYESCGRICDDHLVSGTQVRPVRSWEGAKRYAAKRLGKVEQLAEGVPSPGRSWGKWNPDALPIEEQHDQLSYDQAVKLRRVLRKFTGVNPPMLLRKPTNMTCYVKYSTTQKLLAWLESLEVPKLPKPWEKGETEGKEAPRERLGTSTVTRLSKVQQAELDGRLLAIATEERITAAREFKQRRRLSTAEMGVSQRTVQRWLG